MALPGTADVVQTAADEAAEEAAFEAGFNVADIEPEQPTNTTEEVAPVEPEVKEEPETKVEPDAEPIKAITQDDLNAVRESARQEMQKIHDKVFGKVGELNQRIEAMKSTADRISPKAKERLKTDFPELAAMLFDDEPEPPTAVVVPVPQQPVYVPEVTTAPDQPDPGKTLERRLLTRDHKDWEKIVVSPEFAQWKESALTHAQAQELDETWDADFVSDKITSFKEWQKTKTATTEKTKSDRLESAITPRGVPRLGTGSTGGDDEESAMMAAYNKRT